jgi:hypothetical protein
MPGRIRIRSLRPERRRDNEISALPAIAIFGAMQHARPAGAFLSHRHHMASKERLCPLPFRPSSRRTAPDQIPYQSDRDGGVPWSHAMTIRNTVGCANFDRAHLE